MDNTANQNKHSTIFDRHHFWTQLWWLIMPPPP